MGMSIELRGPVSEAVKKPLYQRSVGSNEFRTKYFDAEREGSALDITFFDNTKLVLNPQNGQLTIVTNGFWFHDTLIRFDSIRAVETIAPPAND